MQDPISTPSPIDSIRRIVQALRVSSRFAETELGISGAQLFAIQKLAEAECPLSLSELAERTMTHLSSISVVVARLVDNGLVQRHASAIDARKMAIKLTAKGQRVLTRAPQTAQEHLVEAIDNLAPEQKEYLSLLLALVVEKAGFSGGEPQMFFEKT